MNKNKPTPSRSSDINIVKLQEELTPAHLRCAWGSCPAVYSLSDGDLLIIGKELPPELLAEIAPKIGSDEYAVKLSPDFFSSLHISVEKKE